MKLHLTNGVVESVHVNGPTAGYAVRSIEVELTDLLHLRDLGADQLVLWVELWLLKFRPLP